MRITIEATPEEVKELLQADGSNLEQQLSKIIHDPSKALKKSFVDLINEENNKKAQQAMACDLFQ
ncbi:hypothetical protein [Enterococcus gallinarum]|uniref:hypothetical protein n=1 Tax=Enterococcus gallinarum TaxID=1353 RepID=UPI003D6B1B44